MSDNVRIHDEPPKYIRDEIEKENFEKSFLKRALFATETIFLDFIFSLLHPHVHRNEDHHFYYDDTNSFNGDFNC